MAAWAAITMSTVNVTSSEFEGVIQKGGITFVDFWAAWCGPCKAFAPVFENASSRFPEINFVKVDTDAESELASAANITSIPTLMAFRDGILLTWATKNGADFLGFDELGTIEKGKTPGLNLFSNMDGLQITKQTEVLKLV